MSKRHTLIENIKLDEHAYLVTIGTDIGQFTGVVECREEDWHRESQYFGFELAEIKAEIQYARAKRRYYDAQLNALTTFWKNMSNTRSYHVDTFWVKKMRIAVNEVDNKKKFWTDRVNYLKETYHRVIITFDSLNTKRNK